MERAIEFEKRGERRRRARTRRRRRTRGGSRGDLGAAAHVQARVVAARAGDRAGGSSSSSSAELREAKGEGRVQAEIAALRVALEARDAEIRKLRGDAEGGDGAGGEAAPMPDHGPGASAARIAAAQAAAGGRAGAAARAASAGTPAPGDKTAEELELEDLLNEVMALKGEAGETTTETPTPTPTETTTETPTAAPVAPVEPERTMESVYAEAYHATLAARKAARRKAEAWAGKEVAVVASSVKEVYHWLGGGPRHGDSAIIYNRRNPNGLGDGGQLFMHLGYNGWQGDPRQVGMRPLSHDHPSRAEYWLNDQGGDWWIAEPVFVPPEANTLDFVFSDGEGEYDNSGGKDYHSPVSGEDGSPPAEVDHVGEREGGARAGERPPGRGARRARRARRRAQVRSPAGLRQEDQGGPGHRQGGGRARPPRRGRGDRDFLPARRERHLRPEGAPARRRRYLHPGRLEPLDPPGRLRAYAHGPRRVRPPGASARSRRWWRSSTYRRTRTCATLSSRTTRGPWRGGTTRGTVWITRERRRAPPAAPSLRCAWCTSRWRWRPSPRLAAWATWSPLSLER